MTYQKRGKSVFVVQWAKDNDEMLQEKRVNSILNDVYGNSSMDIIK